LNKQVMKMYNKYGLHKYAVAITGKICVSRGISIMSEEFIFDYGILSTCNDKAEASQTAGRLKGNIKDWANYKPPTVFTTEKFDTVAASVEDATRRLAALAFERKNSGESTVITKSDYDNVNETVDPDLDHQVLTTKAKAQKFARDMLGEKKTISAKAPKELRGRTDEGPNPTLEYVLKRKWGLGQKSRSRAVTLDNYQVCIYWKPSQISTSVQDKIASYRLESNVESL